MLKIKTDRSDNGNQFLCLDCRHGSNRSGSGREMEVWCSSYDFGGDSRVPFRVTKCAAFRRIDPSQPTNAELAAMQRQAYYVAVSSDGKGTVLIPPDEAKRRKLD